MAVFERLIRFVSTTGETLYGELPKTYQWTASLIGLEVQVFDGSSPFDEDLQLSGKTATVQEVLCPLPDVPFIYGVGLNYRRHAEEGGVSPTFQTALTRVAINKG